MIVIDGITGTILIVLILLVFAIGLYTILEVSIKYLMGLLKSRK